MSKSGNMAWRPKTLGSWVTGFSADIEAELEDELGVGLEDGASLDSGGVSAMASELAWVSELASFLAAGGEPAAAG
jgi:hypothetical protein